MSAATYSTAWRGERSRVPTRPNTQSAPGAASFFAACSAGDLVTLSALLEKEPALVRARDHEGSTPLHAAIAHPAAIRLLLQHGADPNARDVGDNAYALHFAAANGYLETVRALLDAGGDVHGFDDVHLGDVIGWAAGNGANRDVVALLLERGARHHIFSAIASGDPELVRAVVKENPQTLARRRSRFEQGQSALHFALAAPVGLQAKTPQYDIAALLIELGADLEAKDDLNRTPLAVAMLQGDLKAMRLLTAAGAKEPEIPNLTDAGQLDALVASMHKQATPMLCVNDVDAAVLWYQSLGFTLNARHPETGGIGWAAMSFGKAELMLQGLGDRRGNQISLWFHTDRIEELYRMFKARQLRAAHAELAGEAPAEPGVCFYEDLYRPFYGGRQFSIRDVNGFELVFTSDS